MKGSGLEKSEWMPHVNILKDMKKQYEDLKKALGGNSVANGASWKFAMILLITHSAPASHTFKPLEWFCF